MDGMRAFRPDNKHDFIIFDTKKNVIDRAPPIWDILNG